MKHPEMLSGCAISFVYCGPNIPPRYSVPRHSDSPFRVEGHRRMLVKRRQSPPPAALARPPGLCIVHSTNNRPLPSGAEQRRGCRSFSAKPVVRVRRGSRSQAGGRRHAPPGAGAQRRAAGVAPRVRCLIGQFDRGSMCGAHAVAAQLLRELRRAGVGVRCLYRKRGSLFIWLVRRAWHVDHGTGRHFTHHVKYASQAFARLFNYVCSSQGVDDVARQN